MSMAHFFRLRARARLGVVLALLLMALPLAHGHAANFFTGIEDLPVMPGLTEQEGAGLLFDTPAGRFVEAVAQGDTGIPQVLSFYADALPQLGWTKLSDRRYRRDQETLSIDFPKPGRGLTVRFTVSPEK